MKKFSAILSIILSLFLISCETEPASNNDNNPVNNTGLDYTADFTSYKGHCSESMATLFRGQVVNAKYCTDDGDSGYNTDYTNVNIGRWFIEKNEDYLFIDTVHIFSGTKENMIVLSNKEFMAKLENDDSNGCTLLNSVLNLDDNAPVEEEGFLFDFNDFFYNGYSNEDTIWRYKVINQNKIVFNHAVALKNSKLCYSKLHEYEQYRESDAMTCYSFPNDNGNPLSDAFDNTTGGGGDTFDITKGYLSTTSGNVNYKLTFYSNGSYEYENLNNSNLNYAGSYTYSNNELYIKFVKGGSMITEDTYTTTFDSSAKTLKLSLKESKCSGVTSTTSSYGLSAMFNAVNVTEYTLNWNEN